MKLSILSILSLLALFEFVYLQKAICSFEKESHSIYGEIYFEQKNNDIVVTGWTLGLPDGKHGFHIHENPVVNGDCDSVGGHFNPSNLKHGDRNDIVRHVGDLGNIESICKESDFEFTDSLISLDKSSANYIANRSCVIHLKEDDLGKGSSLESQTNGNSGGILVCGNIIEQSAIVLTFSIILVLIAVLY